MGLAFSPLDEELRLLAGRLSPKLAEDVTRLGLWMPFDAARQLLFSLTGARVSEATARRETLAAGEALVALEEKAVDILEVEGPASAAAPRVLQVSMDGAMVPLVGGAWAEARTVVVAELRRDGKGKPVLEAGNLSYYSRMAHHVSFTRSATIETHRRGVEQAAVVIAVNDGAEWIQEFLEHHRPDAVRILDWAHASGYIHAAGHAAFGDPCGAWCDNQIRLLRHEDPIAVLQELSRVLDLLTEDDPARHSVAQCLVYLAKRFEQIQYATFERLGYPIGSGIAESANRVVVQARLKGAGMHWAETSVNPLLALRGLVCSDRWAEGWPAISGQLRHASQYQRRCQHEARGQRRAPQRPARERPPRRPRIVDGRPTQDHPWNRYPAVRRKRAKV